MKHIDSEFKPTLPYYNLLELLGDSLNSSVYKAVSKENPDRFFIIKVLKRPINNESQRRYLSQKVERLKIIHDPRVITPQSFEYYSDAQFIVRRFFPGKTLAAFLIEQQKKISLTVFFNIASTEHPN